MNFWNKRKSFLIIGAIVLIAAVFLALKWRGNKQADFFRMSSGDSVGPAEGLFDAIDGVRVSGSVALLRPLAIMVENHPDARPQSGLSRADVVYETLAEGGITRFLALYQSSDAREIGSVRSAREYFAALADEWGALYAHVGGSNEVIAQIKSNKYKNVDDANEYYNGDFFPRRKDKPEPHHIFTSTGKLRELIAYHKFSNGANYLPWQFKDDRLATTSIISKISIDFSRAGYEVGWEYDVASNTYKRLQYFQPHIDDVSKQQLSAKSVIVQIVKITPVPKDPLLQVDIDLTEGGRAVIFQDGILIDGVWRKESGRTRFYDASNNEIKFNRGPIWLELVPKDKEANLTWK